MNRPIWTGAHQLPSLVVLEDVLFPMHICAVFIFLRLAIELSMKVRSVG